VDGKPTNVRFPEEIAAVRKMISDLPLGSEVEAGPQARARRRCTSRRPPRSCRARVGEEKEFKVLGASACATSPAPTPNRLLLDDDDGVVVTTMSPGYPAAKAELQPGDVIPRPSTGDDVKDLDAFIKAVRRVGQGRRNPRSCSDVVRGRGHQTLVLKVNHG